MVKSLQLAASEKFNEVVFGWYKKPVNLYEAMSNSV